MTSRPLHRVNVEDEDEYGNRARAECVYCCWEFSGPVWTVNDKADEHERTDD